jgi:predicted Zn-dependent protease
LVALIAVGFVAAVGYGVWVWQAGGAERARALDLVSQNRMDEAEPALQELLERRPNDVEVVTALAKVATSGARPVSEAEPVLTRWCELRPNDPAPFRARLDMWLRLEAYDRALADADRVLELDPNDQATALIRPRLMLLVGRFADADVEAAKLLATRPGDPGLTILRAEARYGQGDLGGAAALLDPLVAGDTSFPAAALLRGRVYAEADPPDLGRAITLLRRVAAGPARATERNAARYHLAQALFRAGQADVARRELDALRRDQVTARMIVDARQQPGNVDLHVRAARACLEAGLATDARDLLQAALFRKPHYRPAHRLLADYYDRQGQPELAVEHRRRADLSPTGPESP